MENMMSNEWKDKYFDEKFKGIAANFTTLTDKVDENTKLTEQLKRSHSQTNREVRRIKNEVFGTANKKTDIPQNFWYDPKVRQALLYISAAILAIAGAFTGLDLGGLL
jgi:hypothetical protein